MVSYQKRRLALDERGASDVFMLMLLTLLLGFAGLTYDVGMAFNAKRDATNLAAGAGRAASLELNLDDLYGNSVARMDVDAASNAAGTYLPDGAEIVELEFDDCERPTACEEIRIKVQIDYETTILKILGFDEFNVTGEAISRVQNGPSS